MAGLAHEALLALGVANMATFGRWHEVEDGVLWGAMLPSVVIGTTAATPRREQEVLSAFRQAGLANFRPAKRSATSVPWCDYLAPGFAFE